VWVTAALSFRSLVAATLAAVPVSMGILLVYGFMGFAGIWLGIGTSMFSAIALSIGDDFAMHTVDRLLVLMREERKTLQEAIPVLFRSTGRELFFSTTAILLGFGVLIASHAPTLVSFGEMVIVACSRARSSA
jgi:predicted RND superfamily exporter protein